MYKETCSIKREGLCTLIPRSLLILKTEKAQKINKTKAIIKTIIHYHILAPLKFIPLHLLSKAQFHLVQF